MIDTTTETIFPLSEAPAHIPARRGKRVHVCQPFRWASKGLKAANGERIRLEWIQIGGSRCTSLEALARFFARLSATPETTEAPRTPTQRQRESDRAAWLESVGA